LTADVVRGLAKIDMPAELEGRPMTASVLEHSLIETEPGLLRRAADAVEHYNELVLREVKRARTDPGFADEVRRRWDALRAEIAESSTPTGVPVPVRALPDIDEPGEMIRWLLSEGPEGEFPYVNGAYREMYLHGPDAGLEEPMRMFAGLGLAEDTNRRFHALAGLQKSVRLSTAFDGPTLYGLDSDHEGVFGKVGEGGVAIDTVDDMERLFEGFDFDDERFSVSMTINAPAPVLLAQLTAVARRKALRKAEAAHGGRLSDQARRKVFAQAEGRLRGTVQADILKEMQAQNEVIFPAAESVRFLTDMVEYAVGNMPRFYPISISGYHIAEAGATPIQQAAFTLANGIAYVDIFKRRGIPLEKFGRRLSFFLDCGLDLEYAVLARVCRKVWAVVMRDAFEAPEPARLFRLHTQTSGRSLVSAAFRNNIARTAVELLLAYANLTNSCHSNSADEPFTTPTEEYVRIASHSQSLLLEESGLFKHLMNVFTGGPAMVALQKRVEAGILAVLREIDSLGGVPAAIEQRYFRSMIQESAHRYERQIHDGQRPIIGLNRYRDPDEKPPPVQFVRTPAQSKKKQVERLREFKRAHEGPARGHLERLAAAARGSDNTFAVLVEAVEHCTEGQIIATLHDAWGYYRPPV
jgi:methylmalonyl-CoA mutase